MRTTFTLVSVVALLFFTGTAYGEESDQGSASSFSPSARPMPPGETIDWGGMRDCGPETLTQNVNPDVVESGSVACTPDEGVTTTDNAFARCYEVDQDITVNCVDFGVESSTATQDITVTIYEDTDGSCPPDLASAQVLASKVIQVGVISNQIVTADFSDIGGVIVAAGTSMIVEVSNPDTSGVSAFFIGSNNDGQTAQSYLRSDSCELFDWGTFASVGYPNVHIVQRIDFYYGGEPPVGACCLPNGDCVDGQTPAECNDLGGDWQGTDTECVSTSCPQPPTGACCAGDGMCSDDVAEVECSGLYLGDDTACGADCDSDGATDQCVILQGLSTDCQPNGIPDECDIADGTSLDINDNTLPDECECPSGNGDGTGDAFVDLDDHALFEGCMDGPRVAYQAGCVDFDMDGDCDVDAADFGLFQEAFGQETGPGVVVRAQLAGNSLGEYPWFEFVTAFNEDATVEVAVDPTVYPEIVGQTCDIYITEAKTSGGWAADPSLTDVTAGGAQTETFGGATIQDNTFVVTGAFELDADAGLGLGVGYDMVLDCDQNGELTDGDYIDGLSTEAGLYAVHDTTESGPLAVTEVIYSGGTWLGQDTYYPSNIASMGQLPLIVISHGNGHNYQWYDHIGFHMASYGYIVMSHQNNTGPGIETASTTTLTNTDYILENQGSIAGGDLDGHIDSSRITWVGHSRGAEGVARAYDRIWDGAYTPDHFVLEDIRLISSMLPTDFLGVNSSNPHDANYHLWTAAGDSDVDGSAGCNICQTFHLHDRATHYRQSTVVQGTGHAWFHDAGGTSWFEGPCPIGEDGTHLVQLGYFLPLVMHYVELNIPAQDFLWRQYERFHPIGVDISDPCVVVTNEYRNGAENGNFMIDDYQTESSTGVSSSGGGVSFNVSNVLEGRLDDNNSTFSWTPSDPFNGATQASASDTSRGVVFDWDGGSNFYEWEVVSDARDFTQYLYLSFRGAQGTQHPNTLAVLGDETFTVTLRDGGGGTSSIHIGAYGGGLEQPYQRSGGWHNEMERIRIRITDFLHNGSGLDLSNVVAVRFEFGPAFGSNEGRIVIDELMLSNNYPAEFIPLTMSLPSGVPEALSPTVPTEIDVEIIEGNDALVPGSAVAYYRYTGGSFVSTPLVQIAGELYRATLPSPSCGDTPEFYFSAEGVVTGPVTLPAGAPGSTYTALAGELVVVLDDDFETDQGWTVENDPSLTDGPWERAVPRGDCNRGDPPADFDGSDHCYVTDNSMVSCNSDVDGGPTRLISPTFDLAGMDDPILRYARWWYNDDLDSDPFDVEISNDNGDTWILIERVTNVLGGWVEREVNVTDHVGLTSQMKIRFSADDNGGASVNEAGVDAVYVFDTPCE